MLLYICDFCGEPICTCIKPVAFLNHAIEHLRQDKPKNVEAITILRHAASDLEFFTWRD